MMNSNTLALAGLALLGATPAQAQKDQPPTLHALVGAPDNLKISGSFRVRYEALDGQFRPGFDKRDDILLLRTSLFAEYDAGPVRIGGELIDARAYDVDAGSPVGTGEVNALEPVQAYLTADLGAALGQGGDASLSAGRFTLDLGSRRFAGRNNFRNTTNAFTGLRLNHAGRGKDALTLFYTLPQIREPADKASILDNEVKLDSESSDLAFWGAFYTRPKLIGRVAADFYYFGLDEDDKADLPTRNRRLHTPGLRLFSEPEPGRVDVELEAAYQFGKIRASTAVNAARLDVSAHLLHLEAAYTVKAPWTPRIAFEFDWASGDQAGGDFGRFDGLFGVRRPDFGPPSIYGPLGRANIVSPGVRVDVKPDARSDSFVFYRAAWLDSRRDAFASTGVRDPSGRSGRFAGHQIEGRARYWLVPKLLRLDIGGAVLLTGRFLEEAPNATRHGNVKYGYADVTVTF